MFRRPGLIVRIGRLIPNAGTGTPLGRWLSSYVIYMKRPWLRVVPTAELYNSGSPEFSRSKARVHDRRKDTSATWIVNHHVFFAQMTCPMLGGFSITYNDRKDDSIVGWCDVHFTLFIVCELNREDFIGDVATARPMLEEYQ